MEGFDTSTVDYRATSMRPSWNDLPCGVQTGITRRLAGVIAGVQVPRSGFTPAFAAKISTVDGDGYFVKAAPAASKFGEAASREARILAAMPAGLPASRLLWSALIDQWVVLCLESVDGHMPGHPWTITDLTAVLQAQAHLASVFAQPPAALADTAADKVFGEYAAQHLRLWRAVVGGHMSPDLPRWLTPHIPEMAELEDLLAEWGARATSVMHLDARPDNALVHDDRATLVDWNFAMIGPGSVDVVMMLQTTRGHDGVDADVLMGQHPITRAVPRDAVDGVLAGFGGMLLSNSQGPHVETSPFLRLHQRAHAARSLTWLAERRGWKQPEDPNSAAKPSGRGHGTPI